MHNICLMQHYRICVQKVFLEVLLILHSTEKYLVWKACFTIYQQYNAKSVCQGEYADFPLVYHQCHQRTLHVKKYIIFDPRNQKRAIVYRTILANLRKIIAFSFLFILLALEIFFTKFVEVNKNLITIHFLITFLAEFYALLSSIISCFLNLKIFFYVSNNVLSALQQFWFFALLYYTEVATHHKIIFSCLSAFLKSDKRIKTTSCYKSTSIRKYLELQRTWQLSLNKVKPFR